MKRLLSCIVWTAVVLISLLYVYPLLTYNFPDFSKDEAYQNITVPTGSLVQLKHGKVHYTLEGPENGELVVFMHGISTNLHQMESLSSIFSKNGFRTLRFDFYGRGHSDAPHAIYDDQLFLQQTHDLITTLRESKIIQNSPFHLVALSMGGGVAVVYAAEYPSDLKSLTLLAPAGLPFHLPLTSYLASIPYVSDVVGSTHLGYMLMDKRVVASFHYPQDFEEEMNVIRRVMHYHVNTKDGFNRAFASTVRHFPLTSLESKYEKVGKETNFPVLVVWGKVDKTVPFSCLQQLKELIPRAQTMEIDDGSHSAVNEKAPEITQRIFELIKTTK